MTINGVPVVYTDPGFYGCKERLREAFPKAAMIEVAEGKVTIAWGQEVQTHKCPKAHG
ncbi:CycH [Roseibium sp. TrichSKD4]|uniref:hypothetical protein n=1 Tax=Roseibium sp. TrichSKD4 TaxID=744980 RepID=UPI0001E56234|nr:hypothetical protein [Roseibium sp. TrichSKD4]EFO33787.1 CycH [Roseibium sp. TrichSKD4]